MASMARRSTATASATVFENQGKGPEAFVRAHFRRLQALRRAGHVERPDADTWRVPANVTEWWW